MSYSCKCTLLCPSCHQKRVLLFAEWLDTHILEPVSHAHYLFTIPKLLRPIFKCHRRELGLLCKSAWQALREMLQEVASDSSALPGVVLSVQSYGDRLNLHRHIHAIANRGVWTSDGSFEPIPARDSRHLMLWVPQARPPPPRASTTLTLETDADFVAWEAAGRLFDGID